MLTLDRMVLQQGHFRLSVDWEVAPGARIALIGPSGSGKSTLLLAIAGFLAPVEGRILWAGQDMVGLPSGDRPVSILFQDQNLFPHLTAAQNIGLGLSPRLRLSADQHRAVLDALARVGLEGMEGRKPSQLSGGQAGRVALARALLRARPVLLLDEPFSALGPGMKEDMLALVREVADVTGAAILMVTHDPQDALTLGGRTVVVADGVAHAPQPTAALFADPPEVLRRYLGPSVSKHPQDGGMAAPRK
jgi:thiamine transport system ATP-binding protein